MNNWSWPICLKTKGSDTTRDRVIRQLRRANKQSNKAKKKSKAMNLSMYSIKARSSCSWWPKMIIYCCKWADSYHLSSMRDSLRKISRGWCPNFSPSWHRRLVRISRAYLFAKITWSLIRASYCSCSSKSSLQKWISEISHCDCTHECYR